MPKFTASMKQVRRCGWDLLGQFVDFQRSLGGDSRLRSFSD
jgi:hypothetical protein